MDSREITERLRQGWTPTRVGRRVVWLDETVSTNGAALDMAAEPDADGLVVLADYQTGGRGRLGRKWLSPRGASVLCSVLLIQPEQGDPTQAGRLTVVAAVAACEAIGESTEVRPAIKWPNDLRIGGRKLGGILIESRALAANQRAYVVGFGINCLQHAGHFPPELRDQATSLELAASHPIDRVAVMQALIMQMDKFLGPSDAVQAEDVHAAWLSFAEPIGQRVSLRYQGSEYTGRTVSVDPLGGLTVQLDNGRPMWFDPMLTSVV